MSTQLVNIQPLSQPVDLGVEPATFSPEVEAEIDRHLAKYPVMRSAILPLMFIVQRERGYLDPPGVLYLANRLQLRVTKRELARRRRKWKQPQPPLARGYWRLYFDHVLQANDGADLDFLVGRSGAAVPRDNH